MNKCIQSLSESPCFNCGCYEKCLQKVGRSPNLRVICDNMLGNSEADYHDCGIYIALNADAKVVQELFK